MSDHTHACIRISTESVALAAGNTSQILLYSWTATALTNFLSRLDELNSACSIDQVAVVDRRCKGHTMWRVALKQWCEQRGIPLTFPDGRRVLMEFAGSRGALEEVTKRRIEVRSKTEAEAIALLDHQLRRAFLAEIGHA